MNENERTIFALHGLSGMIIATLLLLVILVILQVSAISAQKDNASNFYTIKDAHTMKKISVDNAKHDISVK